VAAAHARRLRANGEAPIDEKTLNARLARKTEATATAQ
jgi:hypothetical protein